MVHRITTALVVALLAVAGAACGGDDNDTDAAIAKIRQLADRLCACKDRRCADGAMKELAALKEPVGKPTKAQLQKAMKILDRMTDCRKRIEIAAPLAPPAPSPSPAEAPPVPAEAPLVPAEAPPAGGIDRR